MSKDTLAMIIAVLGIAMAAAVLMMGSGTSDTMVAEGSSEVSVEESASAEVVYEAVERTVMEEQEPAPYRPPTYAARHAPGDLQGRQVRDISDLEMSDEEAIQAALEVEMRGYRKGI